MQAAGLLQSERIRALKDHLVRSGSVRVVEAAEAFGVSTETIRRDLRQLASEGIAEIVRGGARLLAPPSAPSAALPPVVERADVRRAEKEAIGRAAAALVRDGQVVLLDGGTTAVALSRHLKGKRDLTIITNNLMVVNEAANVPGWRINVVGGELSPSSMSLVGLAAIEELKATAVDLAFLGAAGISVRNGFTSADRVEAELKRVMIAIARKAVVIADHTKLETSGFSPFATPADIDVFVTSKGADPAALAPIREVGVDVIIAD